MKHLVFVCLVAVGCGGTTASSNPNTPVSSPDLASAPTNTGVSCTQEIALDCANGVDGCSTGATTIHACVASNVQVGPSCSQEIALECPDGQIDACLESPPAAANHLCVMRP